MTSRRQRFLSSDQRNVLCHSFLFFFSIIAFVLSFSASALPVSSCLPFWTGLEDELNFCSVLINSWYQQRLKVHSQ